MDKKKRPFTPEEVEILKANPYTASVTTNCIYFTVAFKQFIYAERQKNELSIREILVKAGYDPNMFGERRMYSIFKSAKKQANSEKGFTQVKGNRGSVMQKDAEKARTKTMIKELQLRVAELEQEVDVLKKIQLLRE